MSENDLKLIKIQGHPILQIGATSIAIKEKEYMRFRTFEYSDIKYLKIYRPYETLYKIFFFAQRAFYDDFRQEDPYTLKVQLHNGNHWKFEIQAPVDRQFIEELYALSNVVDDITIKISQW